MTGFNTQTCEAERSYRLQFETDNREHFLFMQEAARICVDGQGRRMDDVYCRTCGAKMNLGGNNNE